MSNITIEAKSLKGEVALPPDKSISHRAIIIGSLAKGKSQVTNISLCEDCQRTIDAFRKLGIAITGQKDRLCIEGKGLDGLRAPKEKLYLGNSGTSMRLILGVLAGQPFSCMLSGDASLSQRPMKRVTEPLSLMGARISGKDAGEFAPLSIEGANLKPITYRTKVASAQVKSAILLAGLYAQGTTTVHEPAKSRDHSERMLKRFGADITIKRLSVSVQGEAELNAQELQVPGDISAASFFLVGACITERSSLAIKSVGLNPTRIALLKVLQEMQATIAWQYQQREMEDEEYADEARGVVTVQSSKLKAITVKPGQIPLLIDELPALMVAATQAEGATIIQGAAELRVKETDRINSMVSNLARMGAQIESSADDVIIYGPKKLNGCKVDSFGDHRTAMSLAIAGLVASGKTTIQNADCAKISFPGFFEVLATLTG